MLSGKTFLIIGATGRLGCDTVTRLEELGATVLPLVLAGYPFKPKRIRWTAKSDPIIVNDVHDLNKLQTPDYVINFHWLIDRTLPYTKQLLYELDYNIHRITFLWEWLTDKSVLRFINISSIKVFSHLNQNPISADTEPRPISPYGIAKVTAEKFFDAYFHESVFPVVHLRLCSVASFGENPLHLMSQLYTSAFENRRIRINTGCIAYIIYIDEVIDLIINAALTATQPQYIIATSGQSNYHIALKFEQIAGYKINADYVDPAPSIPDLIFITDIQKLRADWTRYTSLESMIKKIIDLRHHYSSHSFEPRINSP